MSDIQPKPKFAPPPKGRRQPGWKVWFTRQVLRALGWRIRGNMPTQFWRTTLLVFAPQPRQFRALRMAVSISTARLAMDANSPSDWSDVISQHINNRQATAIHLDPNLSQLENIVKAAHSAKTRITLCAWDDKRKFVHIHAPFKTSPFPDRDLHYIRRYFAYFAQQTV